MIRRTTLLASVVAIAIAALLPAAAGAASAPAWKLTIVPMPTNFEPGASGNAIGGPMLYIRATNVGGATTDSPITLTDTLPLGLTPTQVSNFTSTSVGTCEIVNQTVTCTHPGPVRSGWTMMARIDVDVDLLPDPTVLTNQVTITGGGATAAQASTTTTITSVQSPFDFLSGPAGLSAALSEADGATATQAGSHPVQFTSDLNLQTKRANYLNNGSILPSGGGGRDVYLDLPRGFIVNPAATPARCTEAQLETGSCPDDSVVGIAAAFTGAAFPVFSPDPFYNMVPPPGVAASFAFNPIGQGIFVHVLGSLRPGDYALSASSNDVLALAGSPFYGAQVQLWGDPSDPSHDYSRGHCGHQQDGSTCPIAKQSAALLAAPTSCRGSLPLKVSADSWEDPANFIAASFSFGDLEGNPTGTEGCNALEFEPEIEARPTTNLAESPSGLDVHLHQPQDEKIGHLSTAALRDISLTLPQGMTLNPAEADGLQGCDRDQIGLNTAIGESPVRFNGDPVKCPNASRLGTVEVTTPVLAQYDSEEKIELNPETGEPIPDPLFGSVYLAKPFDNPFGSLLASYLTVEDPQTGVIAKLAGRVSANPNTGQLVTRFEESPELPLADVNVHLFGGPRAPLITPPLCGTHTSTAAITPWSAPEGEDVNISDSFDTSVFPGGGSCPTSVGAAPNRPAFSAGTISPQAGAYSTFVLKLSREDGSQRLAGIDATLPPGLIGKLAGLTQCSEAQLAQAKAREAPNQGVLEQRSPSCPASSELGVIDVSGGAGPTPIYVQGHAYLTGPYKGAPIGVAIITPAVAGPFDLGTVVLRVALDVDAARAQVHAISDPFPQTLEGIPLDIRGAALKLDRPDFTLNPTSCDPMKIAANATTITGQVAALSSPFQVGGCSTLGFKPKLNLKLKGGTKRGGHPALEATYRPRPGDANAKGLVVRLPRSAFLDQAHIRTICTRVQFAAKACPPGAQYGSIKAWTPLLEDPLGGPVYLRSSDHKLPDLVFDLHGQIDVEVATRIDSVNGGIRASIESAPDAPLSKVVLNMQGAKKGLIVNSRNICTGANKAAVQLDAQNGKVYDFKPELKASCGTRGHRRHGHHHR